MGNTLVDEPVPPTQNQPQAGDRPTLDDVPPAPRRGASPTLIDPPEGVPGQRRGASPTLPDAPAPHGFKTPPAAPLHAAPQPAAPAAAAPFATVPVPVAPIAVAPAGAPVPAAPAATPRQAAPIPASAPLLAGAAATPPAGPVVQAPAAPVVANAPPPQAQAASLPAAPAASPAPQGAPVLAPSAASPAPQGVPAAASPAAASPVPQGAPPPLAFPVRPPPAPGLLAQLPAMPGPRAALPPHLIATPVPDTTKTAGEPEQQAVSAEQASAREALPPPAIAAPSPGDAAPRATPGDSSTNTAPVGTPGGATANNAPPPAIPAGAAPARLAPGARTIVGVAPAPAPQQAGTYQPAPAEAPHLPGGQSADSHSANSQSANSDSPEAEPAAPAGEMRPTVTDSPDAPKKGRARRWIAGVFAVLGVLAIAAVVIGYFVLVRYTPLAERHIPAASNVAIRGDLRQIGTFAPVRKHLWPLLVDRPSKKPGKTFADRVAENTGMNPAIDVRELIVASMDAKSWVVLVGGNFKPGKFVPGMEKVFQEEGQPEWHRSGDMLVGPTGIAMAQAEDGTIILGTEAEIVTASLPASEEYKRIDLPKDGAVGFALSKEAFEELSRDTGAFDPSGAMRRIRHLRGSLTLGDEPAVDIDIEPKGGENADALGKDVESFLGKLRLGLILFPDQMGEKTALSSVKVTVENERVRIRGTWPLDGLDRGCEKLVTLLGLR